MPEPEVTIPREKITIRFARSGGPGGQNVNRVETKVEARFVVAEAEWIPQAARDRLVQMVRSRLNSKGELVVVSSRFRSQARNLEDCLARIRKLVSKARRKPKRRIPTRPTGASRERRIANKRARSQKKGARRWRPGDE